MPAISRAQLAAMYAAKSGHSTLGIPKSVGAEFTAATPSAKGLPEYAEEKAEHAKPRPSSAMEAVTGLPRGKRKTRRGGRRKAHAGPTQQTIAPPPAGSAPIVASEPSAHLHSLNTAMSHGRPDQAKQHALNLAKALHRMTAQRTA